MYYKNEEDDSRKMFSLPSNLEVLSISPQQISFRYLEATYKIIFACILKKFYNETRTVPFFVINMQAQENIKQRTIWKLFVI